MRIRRIWTIMVVFRPSVRKKELLFPITKTARQRLLKLRAERARREDSLQREENVGRVKVVDPRLTRFGAVCPGAVGLLLVDDVTCGAFGFATECGVVSELADAGQHFGGE